ncbi:hypothetical protein D3C87_719990 [compost metagenome]
MFNPSPKHCICDKPFSDCPYATETPHGDKWYCVLTKVNINNDETIKCKSNKEEGING